MASERRPAPTRVWWYRGWCAICRLCDSPTGMALTWDQRTVEAAREVALNHLKSAH